jgi:hypothetical protein
MKAIRQVKLLFGCMQLWMLRIFVGNRKVLRGKSPVNATRFCFFDTQSASVPTYLKGQQMSCPPFRIQDYGIYLYAGHPSDQ